MGIIIGWLLALALLVAVAGILVLLGSVLVHACRVTWASILYLHDFGQGLSEER
ncbi:MAG: hypothetical protein H0V11_03415 [Actinobacteria bacterium]|nr:hypothetical protein [Actinomycetota bacterium]